MEGLSARIRAVDDQATEHQADTSISAPLPTVRAGEGMSWGGLWHERSQRVIDRE
jgi:hypothetical protein